jgi:UDP-N-acetylmuramate--alanine ligase
MSFDLSLVKRVHFIGIGGVGVSALARKFLLEGAVVSGSDSTLSAITSSLEKEGASVYCSHAARNLPKNTEAVVYTKAITKDNPELLEARKRRLPLFSYSQALGELSKSYFSIAVAGSHGKTTTTGMIAYALVKAKKDPTVVVGSLLKDIPSNYIAGSGSYFVMEACEYERSFLDLYPRISVITNIDNDHLDCYGTMANLRKAFARFAAKVPADGVIVADLSGNHIRSVLAKSKAKIVDFSTVSLRFSLKLIGKHNIQNAKAAYAVLRELKIPERTIVSALKSFSGTTRRFEYKGSVRDVLVYDDYAHHPTEVRATLLAAKESFPEKRIVCVFQPHLYSRTKLLFRDFVRALRNADELLLLPIYAAREKKDASISSKKLASAISSGVRLAADVSDAASQVQKLMRKGDVVITMGAGDVWKVGNALLKK